MKKWERKRGFILQKLYVFVRRLPFWAKVAHTQEQTYYMWVNLTQICDWQTDIYEGFCTTEESGYSSSFYECAYSSESVGVGKQD